MDTIPTKPATKPSFAKNITVPYFLVAHSPFPALMEPQLRIGSPCSIGRSQKNNIVLYEKEVSGTHASLVRRNGQFYVIDLESSNGTYLNGAPLVTKSVISTGDILRIGSTVLVFVTEDIVPVAPLPKEHFQMAGEFHAGGIIETLKKASVIPKHFLIVGATGCGKELAARALASMLIENRPGEKLTEFNSAKFANDEQMGLIDIFGVGNKVYSNVASRPGYLEQVGGAVFADEFHNFSEVTQRSFLDVLEQDRFSRVGEIKTRQLQTRIIIASNSSAENYGLPHDLTPRLHTIELPLLKDRRADIPSIFRTLLERRAPKYSINADDIYRYLNSNHYEALCLDGFVKDNIRGLFDIADRILGTIKIGTTAESAVRMVFAEKYGNGSVARRASADELSSKATNYEKNRQIIIACFRETGCNVTKTEAALKKQGIKCSRRWLTKYLKRWGAK